MKGFINVIKPEGMSSAYAVGAVKKKFNCPCGHMGTLDPMASGVLPVGLGKTSRLFDYLLDKSKTYIAVFRFGKTSDTLDITGEITETTTIIPDEQTVKSKLNQFVGDIDQIPPKYSAKCIDGKRGYQLARKGVEFELKPKKVTITRFELLERVSDTDYKFVIDCKGGTYIRSLARDLGKACGSLALMTSLCRTASGVFNLENGVTVDDLKNTDDAEKYIIPSDDAVSFEKVVLTNDQATRILNGLFDKYPLNDGVYRVYNQTEFWGIGVVQDGILKIKAYVR
jgi:tRNA pseudouridine55 synthase